MTASEVLRALGLPADAAFTVTGPARPPALAAPLAVAECAVASVGACLAAAADLALERTGRQPMVALDTAHVAAAVCSEALLRGPDGRGVDGFAPLSRLWPAADGWVRTHANYPWHRAALLAALGVPDGPDEAAGPRVGAAIAQCPADDVERTVYAAGGLAVAARTRQEWAAPDGPVVDPRPLGAATDRRPPPTGALPASGVRVLDLTRVIAGPVGTRMLAALGADVLRVDDPRRPELPLHALDGVIGKASTLLNGDSDAGRQALHRLVAGADVLVTGYRPGAMRRLGLAPDQIADRYPGLIVVTLDAWGTDGPWGGRRGFDSLVQIATGIGWATSVDGERPGALPCQLLDHASGYLVAAGALAALARRLRTGVASHVPVSLVRTARWLLDQGPREVVASPGGVDGYRSDLRNGWTAVPPPGTLDGRPLAWPRLPPAYGQAPPEWEAQRPGTVIPSR